jgi:hypothetical protein
MTIKQDNGVLGGNSDFSEPVFAFTKHLFHQHFLGDIPAKEDVVFNISFFVNPTSAPIE